jgi:hypothetical protein
MSTPEVRRAVAACVLAAIVAVGGGQALAAEVPAELGLLVMLKVLTYDSAFAGRGGDGEFLILVPFAVSHAERAQELVATGAGLSTRSIQGRRLAFEPVPLADLDAQIAARTPAALLVPGDTPAAAVKQIAAIGDKARLYTMSLDEGLVKTGLTVGVALNNGKPQVIINATAAKQIGAEFSNAVMRVARVYQ